MADPIDLARRLRLCCEEDRDVDAGTADAKLWFLALEELIRAGALAEAAYAAPRLAAAFPDSLFIRRLATLLDRMPPAVVDPDFANFVNQPASQVQIVRRVGAEAVLFAFCGRMGSLGFPLPIAHRYFGRLGVHVVYLRDPVGRVYADGIPALGSDRAATVRGLRAAAEGLGATRALCYGNSNGAYAALLYGLEMEAEAVLAMNTVTIFPAARIAALMRRSLAGPSGMPPDIDRLYAAAAQRPRARLVYSLDNPEDAASAAKMSGIPDVAIEGVPGSSGHDVHMPLIEQGLFGPMLERFAAGWPADEDLAVRQTT